jgi:hypothetical protein
MLVPATLRMTFGYVRVTWKRYLFFFNLPALWAPWGARPLPQLWPATAAQRAQLSSPCLCSSCRRCAVGEDFWRLGFPVCNHTLERFGSVFFGCGTIMETFFFTPGEERSIQEIITESCVLLRRSTGSGGNSGSAAKSGVGGTGGHVVNFE